MCPLWLCMSDKPLRRRRAATLADVGREAGVSAMAASAVLNGASTSTRISEETRSRILVAAEKLRYRPNRMARALVDQRMNTLGLVGRLGSEEPNLYFLEVFNGIMRAARARGQNVTVFDVEGWHDARQNFSEFCDGRIDGLILLAPTMNGPASEWLPEHAPAVTIDGNSPIPGVPNLRSDEEGGAFQAVMRLLQLGHRHIIHVGGPVEANGAGLRVQGYERALREAGVVPSSRNVLRGPYTSKGGAAALESWLQANCGESLPHAIFAANDAIALGCLECLSARGIRVPDDVSLIGFDNNLFARALRLSTIAQPLGTLGQQAVDGLLSMIDARLARLPEGQPHETVLPTELIERATAAVVRQHKLTIA